MGSCNDPVDQAVALHRQALGLRERHCHADAETAARRAIELVEAHVGPAHPDVANVANLLAAIREDLDDHAQAESLWRKAVAITRALPADRGDLDRLRVQSLRGLGTNLRRQGRRADAEEHLGRALALAQERLGADDVDTRSTANDLGILYKYTGRFDEAEALYRRVLAGTQGALGPDHPDVASLCHNLAGLAHARGRFDEAEPWARRSVEIHSRALGADHPDTVADAAQLGAILDAQGRSDEA